MTVSGRPVFARVGYGEASARRYVRARNRSHRPPRMWVWRSCSDPGRRDARRYFRRRAVEGSRPYRSPSDRPPVASTGLWRRVLAEPGAQRRMRLVRLVRHRLGDGGRTRPTWQLQSCLADE